MAYVAEPALVHVHDSRQGDEPDPSRCFSCFLLDLWASDDLPANSLLAFHLEQLKINASLKP